MTLFDPPSRSAAASLIGLSGVALIVLGWWAVQLYPAATHTGPYPGAGGQWVFVFAPTATLAVCALGIAAYRLLRLRQQEPELRRPAFTVATAFVTALAVLAGLAFIRYGLPVSWAVLVGFLGA